MADIFVSHATADKALARVLVDLLKEGIGVPGHAIFCSSLKGHGIPFTEDFNDYMKEQIQKPKLVILLMTPSYLESAFCLMELGASWAKSLTALPVVVPPVEFDIVSKTLGLKQAWGINDAAGLTDLRKLVRDNLTTEPRDDHTWDEKRAEWKLKLKKVLKDLAPASNVPAATHNALKASAADQGGEIVALQAMLEKANDTIEALKTAKNPSDVKSIMANHSDEDADSVFEELLDEVKGARPKEASNAVFKHILLDHFDLAGGINWYSSDRDEFERAIQYKLFSPDDGHAVQWGGAKLKPLSKAIGNLITFLASDEGDALAKEHQADGIPMEADDLGFWEYHLDLWRRVSVSGDCMDRGRGPKETQILVVQSAVG